jgi:hydrogenase maturation protease
VILIIGYGNPLRCDDAVGDHIIQALEQRQIRGDIRLMSVYQLTPELVELIRQARCVIFIDARAGGNPGDIVRENVHPEIGTGAFTHHVSPSTLMGAAYELYGSSPEAVLFSVTGSRFTFGETLSPDVKLAVPLALMAVEEIIRQFSDHHAQTSMVSCSPT